MMVEKEIDEIGRMGRSKKQKEYGMKSRTIEDGIGDVGKTRGIWMTELRNVEADDESLRPVDVARGTSDEAAIGSKDVECRRRQRR
jgi:hypothetical protein